MIDRDKITLDWIERVSKVNRNADKILVEKLIWALLLVEGLAKQQIPFIFKGGTALMLKMNSTKRLSIDIDIIIPEEPSKLHEILALICAEQGFVRFEEQQRTSETKIQKSHYRFYYNPRHKTTGNEEFILLDILFEKIPYQKIEDVEIQSSFVPIKNSPLTAKTPSFEDFLSDKLTAFAPNTTGIPYQIYQTALCIATRGVEGAGNFTELQKGIQRISRFIFSESYHIEKAIIHASKAAYLAMLIKQKAILFEKYSNPLALKDWSIPLSFSLKINKLKKSNPEAFYYWFKIFRLLEQPI